MLGVIRAFVFPFPVFISSDFIAFSDINFPRIILFGVVVAFEFLILYFGMCVCVLRYVFKYHVISDFIGCLFSVR